MTKYILLGSIPFDCSFVHSFLTIRKKATTYNFNGNCKLLMTKVKEMEGKEVVWRLENNMAKNKTKKHKIRKPIHRCVHLPDGASKIEEL